VVFSHAVIPPDNLPLTEARAIKPQERRGAPSQKVEDPTWVKCARAVDKLHRRQAELMERAAAST
jgi:hypothetical protein